MFHVRPSQRSDFPYTPLILTIALILLLWVAGGASRADTLGQVVIRAGCWTILVVAILIGPRPALSGARPVVFLLLAAAALPLIQLIPLPPGWWQTLPGREILLIPGQEPPWRPWTMTPGATRNALASLIVPATMLVLLTQGSERVRVQLPTILLAMISTAVLLGLLQFSGVRVNNPFLNDTPGAMGGIFANRNHFALLIAIGCLVAPVWASMGHDAPRWRWLLAAGMVLLFSLAILATGSRSGMLLGALSLVLALPLVGRRLRHELRHAPSWAFPALIVAGIVMIGGLIGLSFAADRAESINRLIMLDSGDDLRSRALPAVLAMIDGYMPFGSGFGGFDPVFRINEPLDLLKTTYLNQAHNDYLGIALDGGIPGVTLLATGILWWLVATIRVWRVKTDGTILLGRLGSATIFLVLIASIFDYPARTPTVMAILIAAAILLAHASAGKSQAALPL